jgi:Fe-S oxidoreductase
MWSCPALPCCGAAGTYAILRPEDSRRVLDRHFDEMTKADLAPIAVVNPGGYRQLQQGVKRGGFAPASCTWPSCWPASG